MLYTRPCMQSSWKPWAAAGLSAGLLELPFPLAGPLPPWRSVFAWFALIPLLWALLSIHHSARPHPLRRAFFISYLCGVLWYVGNCYWIRDTMMRYGDMPPLAPELLTLGFSLVLGLYFGLFGLGRCARPPRHRLHAHRSRLCALPLDRPRPRRRAHHQRSLGPAWLLANRQCARSISSRHGPASTASPLSSSPRTRSLPAPCWLNAIPKAASPAAGPGRLAAQFCSSPGLPASLFRLPTPTPRPPPSSFNPISMWAQATTGRALSGTAISPNSRAWPASSARHTSPASRRPARPRAKSSARPTPLIPTSSSGPNRPRPSSKTTSASNRPCVPSPSPRRRRS